MSRAGDWLKDWRRNKYHLNALLLALPLVYLGHYLAIYAAENPADSVILAPQAVGPWQAQAVAEPFAALATGGVWDVHVRFTGLKRDALRAAFLAIDNRPPRVERLFEFGYSVALHGGRAHLEAHVPVPERLAHDDALWLTVESWDGRVFQTAWPLRLR